tara:strand:+ start:2452 stop:2937 length:486 start_codon:yes stop_codon:yes gene_type:complete
MAKAAPAPTSQRDARADEARPAVWIQPSNLEAPPPRPGMGQKWVATSILGKDIPHMTAKRLREGWVPRKAETVEDDFFVPTIQHGQFEGIVGVEGMILCEMPLEMIEARKRYFKEATDQQNEYVEQQLEDSAPGAHQTRNTKVKRGSGVAPELQEDEDDLE